jgi:hypothetical protein
LVFCDALDGGWLLFGAIGAVADVGVGVGLVLERRAASGDAYES